MTIRHRRRALHRIFQAAAAAALLFGIVALAVLLAQRRSYDVVVADVAIVDGSNSAPWHGNIGIDRGRITALWSGPRWYRAGRVIAGRGLIAAPGFIDTHSHADASVLAARRPVNAWNYVGQGVTTIVTGNCGRSPTRLEDLSAAVARRGINVNIASFIGHNTVKRAVMGAHANEPPSTAQLASMRALVAQAMRDGALGLSTGLAYSPGRFSARSEIVALLETVAQLGGLHASHIRDEGAGGFAALQEVIDLSQAAHIPLFVSHFKITGTTTCGDLDRRRRLIAEARLAGLVVDDDFYPYSASSTNLEPLLPEWYAAADAAQRRRVLRNAGDTRRLYDDVRARLAAEGWQDLGFARVALAAGRPAWNGLRIPQIAELEFGGRRVDQQLRVLGQLLEEGEVQMTYHSLCQNVMETMAADDHTMVGSDSAIRDVSDAYQPHPRGCGTFPRFLNKFVRDEAALTWPEAIWRITGLSADTFELAGRGYLREGCHADVVVFDPGAIRDRATYEHPLRLPEGIAYVLVNGQVVYEDGRVVPSRMPGRFLRRGEDPR